MMTPGLISWFKVLLFMQQWDDRRRCFGPTLDGRSELEGQCWRTESNDVKHSKFHFSNGNVHRVVTTRVVTHAALQKLPRFRGLGAWTARETTLHRELSGESLQTLLARGSRWCHRPPGVSVTLQCLSSTCSAPWTPVHAVWSCGNVSFWGIVASESLQWCSFPQMSFKRLVEQTTNVE
jgi:hypothetical protein